MSLLSILKECFKPINSVLTDNFDYVDGEPEVCEWVYNTNLELYHTTLCGQVLRSKYVEDYTFCPHCGNTIVRIEWGQ